MKVSQLRRFAPDVRTPLSEVGRGFASAVALPATWLAYLAAALLATAALVAAIAVVPETLPVLVAGWAVALVAPFALPFAVVRGVVAVLERVE